MQLLWSTVLLSSPAQVDIAVNTLETRTPFVSYSFVPTQTPISSPFHPPPPPRDPFSHRFSLYCRPRWHCAAVSLHCLRPKNLLNRIYDLRSLVLPIFHFTIENVCAIVMWWRCRGGGGNGCVYANDTFRSIDSHFASTWLPLTLVRAFAVISIWRSICMRLTQFEWVICCIGLWNQNNVKRFSVDCVCLCIVVLCA